MCNPIMHRLNNFKEPDFQQVTTYHCLIYSKDHMHLTIWFLESLTQNNSTYLRWLQIFSMI
jgi:hypothetical protein